jgi:acetyl esterase
MGASIEGESILIPVVSPEIALEIQDVAAARALAAAATEAAAGLPSTHTLPLEVQRSMMRAGAEPQRDDAEATMIAGVPVRVLLPAADVEVRGTYLHLHGGGWTMGAADIHDQRLTLLADEVGVRVISVEYRLAPEHPWPAAADDCEAVGRTLADSSDSVPLLIGGESAGAHLSTVTLLRLRSPAFVGANLAYGCYDLAMTEHARAYGERSVVLSAPIVAWHLDQLLPDTSDDERRDRAISPLYEPDLDGLPPALFTVGDDDPLYDDSVQLAARWPNSTLEVYEGGFHAFDLVPGLRVGEIAAQRQLDFLRRCLE